MRRPYQFRVAYKDSGTRSGRGFTHVYTLADAQKHAAHLAKYNTWLLTEGKAIRFEDTHIETRAADGTWQAL